jgi:hypothetical protein
MQIKLTRHEEQVSQGFILPKDLVQIENSTCTRVEVWDVLDYWDDRESLLADLVSKLRYNGEIIIEGLDILEVANKLIIGAIDYNTAKGLLYNGRLECSILEDVQEDLKSHKLTITKATLHNNRYYVTAKRTKK